jgi:hypothetical protein
MEGFSRKDTKSAKPQEEVFSRSGATTQRFFAVPLRRCVND